jgi:trk system potassium uptake protein TrkA
MLELTLPSDAPIVGTRVGDVAWPHDTVLVAIIREGRPLAPSKDDPLEAGDELLFVSAPDQEAALHALLAGDPAAGAATPGGSAAGGAED